MELGLDNNLVKNLAEIFNVEKWKNEIIDINNFILNYLSLV